MSTELRSLSFAVLVLLAAPALATGRPTLVLIAALALSVAAAGLLPPVPPMVNGLVAVLAGAVLSACAIASGHVGLAALFAAPLAVASLRFGWRAPLWSLALAVLGTAWFVPEALRPSLVASPVLTAAIAACALAWGVLHLYLGRRSERQPVRVAELAPSYPQS